jgi:outer membrane protein OmpA-like peptidoglycan-associated protein
MYPGQGISVNPRAGGTQVLLYPGGQYVRLVPSLAQPGAPATGLEPIHLHMPGAHRIARVHRPIHVAAADQPAATDTTPLATPQPAPARHRKHESKTEIADAAPPDASAQTGIPFSFSGASATPPATKTKQKPAPAPKPVKVASAEPPPAQMQASDEHLAKDMDAGLSKRGEILFKHDATDPAPAQFDGLKLLAGDLTSALQAGATRIQLQAYGGSPGDKGSDARRLSLKRALAIRQVLIDNGVPSTKIDVRAMGGSDDKGNADRVDVFVRAG